MSDTTHTTIRVGHSPDSDDAFMFYALTHDKLDTGGLRFVHQLEDIETLNQRALKGELEVSAVSIHAFAYLADRYALLASGSSMGDRYGPTLVTREPAHARRPAGPDDRRAGQAHDGLSDAAALPGQATCRSWSCRSTRSCRPSPRGGSTPACLIHEGQLYYGDRGLAQGRRPGRVVVRADGAALAAGRQRGPQGPGRGDGLADRPALEGEHPLCPGASPGGARLRAALRPRPRPGAGGPVRRDVRQRLDDRLRPAGPRGRPHAAWPRGGSGFSPGPG